MKKLVLIFYFSLIVVVGLSFLYYLPTTKRVYLVGTEIKREVRSSPKGERFKDVRYVVARDIPNGQTLMFRNEDIAWPPYFKFDSGDLSGKVMNFKEHSPEAEVLATYYGLRVPFLSFYPNITDIKKLSGETSSSFPLINWIVLLLSGGLALAGLIFILRKFKSQDKRNE